MTKWVVLDRDGDAVARYAGVVVKYETEVTP